MFRGSMTNFEKSVNKAVDELDKEMRLRRAENSKRKRNCLERAWIRLTRGRKLKEWELLK